MGLFSGLGKALKGLGSSVLGAVAGPLAGAAVDKLLGGSKKASAQGVDYVKLRNDAQAAGFNPLTALLAGGGQGYQREFNPALSSGSFIAEAVSRGVDSYFNTPDKSDKEAEYLRMNEVAKAADARLRGQRPPGSFGYNLTDAVPFAAHVTYSDPSMTPTSSGGRPKQSPLSREPDYIPVRSVDGQPARIEKTIARRLGIEPWDTLSVGDMEELLGDVVGEAHSTLSAPWVVGTALGEGPFARGVRAPALPPAGRKNQGKRFVPNARP